MSAPRARASRRATYWRRLRQFFHADRLVAGEGYAAHDFVFADEQGEPLRADVVSNQWQRAIGRVNAARTAEAEAAGVKPTLLPVMRLYDARHTCATLLLEAGVPMRVVQEILRTRP